MSIPVKNFLKARKDRSLGWIMGYAEREIFSKLTKEEQLKFRSVVLESLNSYHDTTLDLFKAEDDGIRNDELLKMLERIDRKLV